MGGYVYEISNAITGIRYIGSTCNIEKRFKQHKSTLNKNVHQNTHLQRSYNKHGESAFLYNIIWEGEDYQKEEQRLLTGTDWNTLYNMNRNVSGGDILSYHPNKEEICKRISTTLLRLHNLPSDCNPWRDRNILADRNPNWKGGDTVPRCACGELMAHTAKTCSDCRDRTGSNNPFYGRSHTEETKKLLANNNKGVTPASAKSVSIEGVIYKSYREASDTLGVPVATVHHRCNKSKDIKFKGWFEAGKPKIESTLRTSQVYHGKPVMCEGVRFATLTEAASFYKLSITAMHNRIKSKNYPDFKQAS